MKSLSFFRGFAKSVKSEKIQLILVRCEPYLISYWTWYDLALNINICEKAQLILAEHYDSLSVRANLALNPNISNKAAIILAKNESFTVRENLARNIYISEDVQMILARDRDYLVRKRLLENESVLKRLNRY